MSAQRPRRWRIAYLVASLVGLALSADLLRLHVRVHTDPNYHSYCAISEGMNCDTVALSPYAVFAGLPVAVWGLFGFGGMALLAAWGLRARARGASWPLGLQFWLAALSSLAGVALAAIAQFVVGSLCLVCAATYLVSFALLAFAFLALRGVGLGPLRALRSDLRSIGSRPKPVAVLAVAAVALVVATAAGLPRYWVPEAAPEPAALAEGETAEGHPWIGARSPRLEIVEYSDYQCPYCERAHRQLRRLIEAYPDRVRLVHRHFPLDQACNPLITRPFHVHACRYARMASCAGEQERFWKASDYLYAQGRRPDPVSAEELAARVGLDLRALQSCLGAGHADEELRRDVDAGRTLGVEATPTFVVDGQVYTGSIPVEVLRSAILTDEEKASSPTQTP